MAVSETLPASSATSTFVPRSCIAEATAVALVSGPSGLEAIEAIVTGAFGWLSARGGALVVELAPHQVGAAVALVETAGFHEVLVQRDLAGRDRVLVARRLR
jgi:release factor glutamine methyltransferase